MDSGKTSNVITWYTQPKASFASFYYYDKTAEKLVRVRLELGRTERGGHPGAFLDKDRHVGFADPKFDQALLAAPSSDFSLNKDQISVKVSPTSTITLETAPKETFVVCDFSGSDPSKLLMDDIHIGNAVNSKPNLPSGVTGDMLEKVALKAIASDGSFYIAQSTDTGDTLAAAIKKLAS